MTRAPLQLHTSLAINTAVNPSLPPAELEAAFIDPDNWTWNDGSTGSPMLIPILSETTEHDLRNCWLVPQSDPNAGWTIIYDADFGLDGGKALGYATTPDMPFPVGGITVPLVQDKVDL